MEQELLELIEKGKNFTVLYVEDDESLQRETLKVLDRIFHTVVSANNGLEALEAFQNGCFDLIITDIEMPKLNGLQLSEAVKKENSTIPIIVVSAYSNAQYFIEAIKIGISNYILKPINMSDLMTTLLRVLTSLVVEQEAKEASRLRDEQIVNQANITLLSEIVNANPHAQLVFKEDDIVLVNAMFKKLFSGEKVEPFLRNKESLRTFLNAQMSSDPVISGHCSDYIESIDDFSLFDEGTKKVAIKTDDGRKLFLLQSSQFKLADAMCELYVFNDITLLEYQSVQLDSYQGYMNDLAYEKYKQSQPQQNNIINKTEFS